MDNNMEVMITPPSLELRCSPVCLKGELNHFIIANDSFQNHRLSYLKENHFKFVTIASRDQTTIYMPENIWAAAEDLARLSEHPSPIRLMDENQRLLAWKGPPRWQDCLDMIPSTKPSVRVQYPWHLLKLNEIIGATIKTKNNGDSVSPLSEVRGSVTLGEGSRILAGVTIEGNVSIGKNTRVGPNCYIRGTTSIGDNCIIGNAVEIKNSIIGNNTSVAHLTYVGDSILSSHINLGPCSVLSNTSNDDSEHTVNYGNTVVRTGTNKLGSFVGEYTRTAANTVICPATLIPPHTKTESGTVLN